MDDSSKNSDSKYFAVKTGKVMIEDEEYDSYGIRVDSGGEIFTIDNVSDDKEYTKGVADYLNKNGVSPEHLMQILEELLCRYPAIWVD